MSNLSADSTPQITLAEIDNLVDVFYGKVQLDPLIGPIFLQEVEDWPAHLALLKDFWASSMLGTGSFKGNPLETHLRLPKLNREHFERWLALFAETASEQLVPAHAALFVTKSRRIAETFQRAIAARQGGLGIIPSKVGS
ncbi:group III truncated hemoglobin [Acidicapsa ligni]|uniref:group III truncated hemoglobin n=1 Tax=Acidicapsa ligni TaxID=542300 RepID=UPI0021DFAD0D|nr:group III truncated hemoglobin [Acidicapsa ligni]